MLTASKTVHQITTLSETNSSHGDVLAGLPSAAAAAARQLRWRNTCMRHAAAEVRASTDRFTTEPQEATVI